ncbi:MAG: NHL repeat-containing protein [Nitrospiraceae bacterium]|nr:MAG: NHL repeat-containing protein [Nitrospiraceae bacterium]
MRGNAQTGYCGIFRGVLLVVLLAVSSVPETAWGMRLTYVRHLFDITHRFSQPSDVAVSPDGMIYIVDGVNNEVKVFNRDGSFAFSFGSGGALKGQLNFPMGIAVGSSGKVYVADSGNHRVQIFSPRGSYLSHVNLSGKIKLSDPTDVAVDEASSRLYVADNDNHHILMYDLSGLQLLQTIGGPGSEKREFRYPFLMTLDRNKYLYVTDVVNTRVQSLNPDGLFVAVMGGWGVEKGNFFRPKGIAADRDNRIYVSDSYMGVIQVFRGDGPFYSAAGDPQTGRVKKFITPMGLFIDSGNRLYVVEMFAERVGVYAIEGDSE